MRVRPRSRNTNVHVYWLFTHSLTPNQASLWPASVWKMVLLQRYQP